MCDKIVEWSWYSRKHTWVVSTTKSLKFEMSYVTLSLFMTFIRFNYDVIFHKRFLDPPEQFGKWRLPFRQIAFYNSLNLIFQQYRVTMSYNQGWIGGEGVVSALRETFFYRPLTCYGGRPYWSKFNSNN